MARTKQTARVGNPGAADKALALKEKAGVQKAPARSVADGKGWRASISDWEEKEAAARGGKGGRGGFGGRTVLLNSRSLSS